jgi:hypothetical protein
VTPDLRRRHDALSHFSFTGLVVGYTTVVLKIKNSDRDNASKTSADVKTSEQRNTVMSRINNQQQKISLPKKAEYNEKRKLRVQSIKQNSVLTQSSKTIRIHNNSEDG